MARVRGRGTSISLAALWDGATPLDTRPTSMGFVAHLEPRTAYAVPTVAAVESADGDLPGVSLDLLLLTAEKAKASGWQVGYFPP